MSKNTGAKVLTIDYAMATVQKIGNLETNDAVTAGLRVVGLNFVRLGRISLSKSAKRRTGRLEESFRYRIKRGNKGVLAGFSRSGSAHFINRGTENRYTKAGKFRGRVKPTYFWDKVRYRGMVEADVVMGKAFGKALKDLTK